LCELCVEGAVAAKVGLYSDGAEEECAFAKTGGFASGVGKEFDAKAAVGRAVERATHFDRAGVDLRRFEDDREVLEAIAACVPVTVVVEGDALTCVVGREVDAELGIAKDVIAQDAAVLAVAGNEDTVATVVGDAVALCDGRATHDGFVGILNLDTIVLVGQARVARGVDTDVVAGDLVAVAGEGEEDAFVGIAGDHVAVGGGGAANQGIGCFGQKDALGEVGPRRAAGDVGADVVAADHIATHGRKLALAYQDDAKAVAGEDIACNAAAVADDVGVTVDIDTALKIGGDVSCRVQANHVAANNHVVGIDLDAIRLEAVDGEADDARAIGSSGNIEAVCAHCGCAIQFDDGLNGHRATNATVEAVDLDLFGDGGQGRCQGDGVQPWAEAEDDGVWAGRAIGLGYGIAQRSASGVCRIDDGKDGGLCNLGRPQHRTKHEDNQHLDTAAYSAIVQGAVPRVLAYLFER
jgi:hypothetical protein